MGKKVSSKTEQQSANHKTAASQTSEPAGTTLDRAKSTDGQRASMIATFEPVRTESTAGVIATQIRDALMAGTLGPGSQLAEAELATVLKVSRGPVREALQRLVQEGVLTEVRNRGVFVPKFDADDVTDIYLSRRAIESAAVIALIDSETTDTQALERVLRQMNAAVKGAHWSTVAGLDGEFHHQLVKATRSSRLARMHDTLMLESRICILALEDAYQATEELVEEHNLIYSAIQARDKPLALRLITDHMKDAAQRLRVLLEIKEEPINLS